VFEAGVGYNWAGLHTKAAWRQRYGAIDGGEGRMQERTIILLEGNIGAGKSTVGNILKASGMVEFIEEPVDTWQSGFAANLLEAFYRDMNRWAFTFQTLAFLTRARTWNEALARTSHKRVVLERSLLTDRYVFAANAHRIGAMTDVEWQVYCALWDLVVCNYNVEPDCILYYRTPADVCMERIKIRARVEEAGIAVDYLLQLETLHDQWLLENPRAVILDGRRHWAADEVFEMTAPHVGLEEQIVSVDSVGAVQ
jgi:deoxyadenosine/deoxycytidine kinase